MKKLAPVLLASGFLLAGCSQGVESQQPVTETKENQETQSSKANI